MLGIEPELGASVLRLGAAAGPAILLILFCMLAFFQPQLQIVSSPARRTGFVIAGAILGAVLTWAFFDRGASGDGGAERRTFELRAGQLSAHAFAPGSPLACLDPLAGDSVQTACEKTLFASPANIAAASSYVEAQLTLLSNMAGYAQRGDADEAVAPLRRSLEADRFGFVAHVLAIRHGCTSQNCKTLALLRDAERVRANLSAATFDRSVEHYAALWGAAPEGALADVAPAAQTPRKPINIDFPTAASIPAVSIMNAEASGPVVPGAAAAAASNPNPAPAGMAASSPRHARKQSAAPPAGQPPSPGSAAVEPIWPEPLPPSPASTPTPQTAAAPAAAAPVQLTPPSPTARTQ
jgi:hypothetical protein